MAESFADISVQFRLCTGEIYPLSVVRAQQQHEVVQRHYRIAPDSESTATFNDNNSCIETLDEAVDVLQVVCE